MVKENIFDSTVNSEPNAAITILYRFVTTVFILYEYFDEGYPLTNCIIDIRAFFRYGRHYLLEIGRQTDI
jgi:hypothetical protein